MINYPINEAETIFEPFYDGGESYPDNEKYSLLGNYTVTYAEGTVADVHQTWCEMAVKIQHQTTDGYSVKMERDCDLDVRDYDIFRVFGAIDAAIDMRVQCVIDGETVTVIETKGAGTTCEVDGKFSGQKITHFSMEFRLNGETSAVVALHWLGLSNAEKQAAMEAKKSPYNDQWEGCFVENPEIKPLIGIYFGEEDLDALRQRLSKEPFLSMVNALREKAKECMEIEPEQYITDYLPGHDRRWVRDRDMERPMFQQNMDVLAFIGLLDENIDMLRMACRKLLSIAVTPYWTESIMGRLPGATWHHRSFTEDATCSLCAHVLDFAGSLLTWHGKNIVYDALMLKGLPRFESDFHSVNYIREMNQGIVFSNGRILALLALADRYPRYEARLQDAAKDLRSMIDFYVMDDGGTSEGPGYWNYTFMHALTSVSLLARHSKMPLKDYAWDKLKKTGEFALAMISDAKDGTYTIPVNDAHSSRYAPVILAVYNQISQDDRWNKLYGKIMMEAEGVKAMASLTNVLLCSDMEPIEGDVNCDGFSTLNTIGHTSLRRTAEDVGRVHCYLSGGPNYFAHCHSDKGQILLEVDHNELLIDRGICAYSHPAVYVLGNAYNHNLFYPEAPEGQMAYDQDSRAPGAKILRSFYENGVFDYCTDTTGAWQEGIFTSITRSVKSPDTHIYLIYDDAVMVNAIKSSFRLHTYGEITQEGNCWKIVHNGYQVTVTPVNYTPASAKFGEDGIDGELNPVNSLKLYLDEAKEQHLVTLLEVSKAGQQKAKVLSESEIDYNGQIYNV